MLQLIDVHVGHLNRRQLPDLHRIAILLVLLNELVVQLYDAPDAAAEKPVILLRILVGDRHGLQTKIGKLGLIDIALDIQANRDLVDDGIAATSAEHGEDLLGFIRAHKVVRQNPLYVLDTLLDDFFIIGAAILPQKKLKDIDGYIGPFLDFLSEVFPDNFPVETLAELALDDFTGIHCTLGMLIHDVPP